MKYLLLLIYILGLLACTKEVKEPIFNKEELDNQEFIKYIEKLPEINSPEIKQNLFKKVDLQIKYSFNLKENFVFDYSYDTEGKIKSIKSDREENFNFEYAPNTLNRISSEGKTAYVLDNNGLATRASDLGKIYYKNGYYVLNSGPNNQRLIYSKEGNIVERNNAKYEYTDYPNTIKQDIKSSRGIHSTFRDSYLGKYSTNLLKKAQINDGPGEYILNFKYEFDAQNRVELMTIEQYQEPSKVTVFVYRFWY
jgi:hypothetical protein